MRRKSRLSIRELARLRTEKTILLAILVQLLIASFSSILVIGFVSVYDPGTSGMDIEYAVTGEERDVLLEAIDEQSGVSGNPYIGLDTAREAYDDGDVDAILLIEKQPNGRLDVNVYAPEEGLMKTLVISRTQTLLQEVEEDQRYELSERLQNKPLAEPDLDTSASHFEFIYTMLIPVLVFLPAFISGALIADSFTEGYSRGTLELLRVTPFSDVDILDAKVAAMAALAPVQAATWMGLLRLNGIPVSNIPYIVAVCTGLSLVIVALGASIAIYYKDRGQSQFIYSVSAMLIFALFYILPEQPINMLAKITLDSMGPATQIVIGAIVCAGVLSYVSLRWFIARRGL